MAINEKEFLNNLNPEQTGAPKAGGRRLRVGFIGTGGIAHAHIRSYLNQPDVDIVAGADLVPGKAEAFFAEFGLEDIKCYTDFRQMLAECNLDAVSVCTYNRTHAECAIGAMHSSLLK